MASMTLSNPVRISAEELHETKLFAALGKLPQIARAFERGKICLYLASELTQVASSASEEEWLELVGKESRPAVHFHLEHARDKKIDSPRRGGYGLPGRPVMSWRRTSTLWWQRASRRGAGN